MAMETLYDVWTNVGTGDTGRLWCIARHKPLDYAIECRDVLITQGWAADVRESGTMTEGTNAVE